MEPVTIIPSSQKRSIPNDVITLEEAKEKLCELLLCAESNAWELGDLLNAIERRRLFQQNNYGKNYGKAREWLEAEVPEAQGKLSTLSKYADVAAIYTKEQVERWGMAKLYCLMVHDGRTQGHRVPGDPADRDIELLQEDGSTLEKKFGNCTCRELERSNASRRKARKGPDKAKGSSAKHKPATIVQPAQAPIRSVKWSLAVLGLGMLLAGISEYLPHGVVSTWLFVLGTILSLTSAGMLLSHWRVWRDRLFSAAKDGKAMVFLKEHIVRVGRQTRNAATAFHRWLMKVDHAPSAETTNAEGKTTPSEERTPPNERKAA